MIDSDSYRVAKPEELPTPAMIVFRDLVGHNIRSVCEVANGGQNLFTHVKTHKSFAVTRMQIAMGIDQFKCATLAELEMVLQAGARKALLAYPLTQEFKIERLLALAASHPDQWVATIASSPVHLEMLGGVASRRKQRQPVMLDLDDGMHRTGIRMDSDALQMYREIGRYPFLEAAGLHLYDGHDSFRELNLRAEAALHHIGALQDFRRQIESSGMPVPFIVAGGAYSFAYYARTEGMHGSPGSFIYWDHRCRSDMPDMPFRNAALILTQVVDRHPEQGTFTTDLGYKNICSDQPIDARARLLGHETATLVMHSEEYGVFRVAGDVPAIGTYLLAEPGHIGPTTVRYPGSYVVDSEGSVVDFLEHTARDRVKQRPDLQ
jgi:D-serine deaminase-like pyridoxal phosphate-dependent protein